MKDREIFLLVNIIVLLIILVVFCMYGKQQGLVLDYIQHDKVELLNKNAILQKQIKDYQDQDKEQEKFVTNRCVCTLWESSSNEPALSRQEICSNTDRSRSSKL